MRAVVCIACHLGCAVAALAEADFNVRVYNQARTSPTDVRAASIEAGRILRNAGVNATVQSCAEAAICREPLGDTGDIVLILRRTPPAGRDRATLGHSILVPSPRRSRYSFVYMDSVSREAARAGLPAYTVLANAIAHETGHVLLGADHARSGLMRSHWGPDETRRMRTGTLGFEPEQIPWLRSAASMRSGSDDLLAAVPSPRVFQAVIAGHTAGLPGSED